MPTKTRLKRPKMRRKVIVLAVATAVVGLAGVSGTKLWSIVHPTPLVKTPIPSATVSATGYPLYYPASLPASYQYDASSLSTSNEALLFSFNFGEKHRLNVTQQSKNEIALNSILGYMKDRSIVNTPYGEATLGTYNGRRMALFTSDKSMVMLQTIDDIDQDDLKSIVKALRPLSK